MSPNEQTALEDVAGRALLVDEMAVLGPLVEVRNDVAIATLLSVGRTRLVSRTITARGVRGALSIPDAMRFLNLLRDTAESAGVPDWLINVLATTTEVAVADYPAYRDTFACAHDWLQQAAGLDLGDPTTRAGLDLIAASDQEKFGATVATLKALAEHHDPIPFDRVSAALNKAQGLMTL